MILSHVFAVLNHIFGTDDLGDRQRENLIRRSDPLKRPKPYLRPDGHDTCKPLSDLDDTKNPATL